MWSFWQLMFYWLLLSLVPYFMYVIAYIWESRTPGYGKGKVPVWKGQSRAFLPGDFGLALFLAIGLDLYTLGDVFQWMTSYVYIVLAGPVFATIVFTVGRKVLYNPNDYTPEAWRSPSKLWHDGVMFILVAALAAVFALPGYFSHFNVSNVVLIGFGLSGLILWVLGLAYDAWKKQVPNQYQHPSTWKPIWKK